ncbi:MAG: acetyl-CoA carboxylase biotin carboxyl carrier protein [Alphaproteobacteria bacterium]|nr:acetyl-CoA carboxylase biotin carboxyl carrier protein [Alphaproteobacteria bacterium]
MAKAPKTTSSPDTDLVKALADILDDAGLAELEYETDAVSVRLSRVTGAAPVAAVAPAPVAAAAPAAAAPSAPAADSAAAPAGDHPGAVKSPMVGTIYTAPEPGADEFVTLGASVKKGQTLFIVEAMKVMNPITAPSDGKVTNILVQNAQPIEFDQVLIVIE